MTRNDNKTQPTAVAVENYMNSIPDEGQKADCKNVLKLMEEVTGLKAQMWGKDIVGLGQYHYVGKSGREGEWFKTGFAPRKNQLSLYFIGGFDKHQAILDKLGKHKLGKGCLYVKNLENIDIEALKELISANIDEMNKMYPEK